MKKQLIAMLAVLMSVVNAAWADGPFRAHRYDSFKTLPAVGENDVVFIGNSITNMFNWWEALGSCPNVKGRGNSGAVTQEVLDNLESMIAGQPAKVFLMIGTNDLGTTGIDDPTYVANQIKTIITRIRKESPRTMIYCQSILPSGLRDAAKIVATNTMVEAWISTKDDEQVMYVDLYPHLNDGTGKIKNTQNNGTAAYSYDNLHLTALGYQVWLKAIEQYLPEGCSCQIPEGIETLGSGLGNSPGMRSTYFGALPVKASDILIIGDEMIHGGEWHELIGEDFKDRGIGWGYPGVNISDMQAELETIFKGNVNKGVVKQTPKAVCLYAGVADCNANNYDETAVKSRYKTLVEGIRAQVKENTPIFLMTLAPHPTAANNDRAKALNNYMKELAEADANLHVIDLHAASLNAGSRIESYFMGTNNAYISGMGYVAFAQTIKNKVNEVMGTEYTCISLEEAQQNLARFNQRKTIGDATNLYALVDNYVGEGIGQYSAAAVQAYKAAVEPAFEALQNTTPNGEFNITEAMNTLVQQINPITAEAVNGKQFALSTPNRGTLYAYTDGAGLNSTNSNPGYKKYRWEFEAREDGTFNIKNQDKECYMDPSAAHDTQIKMSAQAPSAGWTMEWSSALGLYIIKSGTNCELNSTDKTGNPIYNWHNTSTATNRTDKGCQWQIEDVTDNAIVPNPDPINVVTGTAQEGSATLVDGHIYTITNRQKNGSCYPLYVTDGLQVGQKNALAAKSYGNRAQFRAIKKDDKWAFQSLLTDEYLIWKGNDSGYNGNAGVMGEYNSTYCALTITAATSVTDVVNGKILTGKRNNGTENGTFVQNTDGTWNKWRDPSVGYTDTYSNIYTFGDVTESLDGEVEEKEEEVTEGSVLVNTSTGSLNNASGFSKKWTHSKNPVITLTAGANNMNANSDGTLNLYMGTMGNTYTIEAPVGFIITGYSATVSGNGNTITPEGREAVTVSNSGTALNVEGLKVQSTTFTITGQNTANKFADFKINFKKYDATEEYFSESFEEATWLRINNKRSANYSLTTKEGDKSGSSLHSALTDASADGQIFAFVGNREDGFYIYNKVLGEELTLTAANTNNATAVTWGTTKTKWYLLDNYFAENGGYMLTTSKTATTSMNMYGGVGQDIKFYTAPDGGGSLWTVSVVDEIPTVIHYTVEGEKKYNDANQWVGQLKIQKGSFTSESLIKSDVNGTTFSAYLPKNDAEVQLSNYNLHGWIFSHEVKDGEHYVTYTADPENEYQYLGFRPDAQWYRIPAISKAQNGDLVAIYDWRVCHSDVGFGEVDQRMRRSTDNGQTWSEEEVIADGNGGGKVFGAAFGDPALAADRESGKMTLITVSGTTAYPYATGTDHNLIAAQFSDDNGATWSQPQDITKQFWGKAGAIFADAATEDASTTFAYSGFFGSGKILQSRTVKVGEYYRIYAAMLCRGKNVQGAYVVYSDDMGHNWNLLGGDNTVKAASGSDEPKVEELPNGDVVLSCRKSYGRYFNIWKWSQQPTAENPLGAGKWGEAVQSNQQTGGISVGANSCNGEILYVECAKADGTPAKLMMQSLPSGNDRSGVEIWFKDITNASAYASSAVFAQNWTRGLRVSPQSPEGFSAYSTMTIQADGRIGFFYEEGPATYCMVYVPLTLEQITDNLYTMPEQDDPTGIIGATQSSRHDGHIYDLSGRQLDHLHKGVNIVDGKKVIK